MSWRERSTAVDPCCQRRPTALRNRPRCRGDHRPASPADRHDSRRQTVSPGGGLWPAERFNGMPFRLRNPPPFDDFDEYSAGWSDSCRRPRPRARGERSTLAEATPRAWLSSASSPRARPPQCIPIILNSLVGVAIGDVRSWSAVLPPQPSAAPHRQKQESVQGCVHRLKGSYYEDVRKSACASCNRLVPRLHGEPPFAIAHEMGP